MNVPKILYVDDEANNLVGFKAAFSLQYDIITTTSTNTASELITNHTFEIILIDYKMPKENGIDFVNRIYPLAKNSLFIIISAYAELDVVIKALNLNRFYGFIQKPWNPAEVEQMLKNAIETHQLKMVNSHLMEQLVEKNAALEESIIKEKKANALKDVFLKNISHEIRTPLNGIIGFNNLIQNTTNFDKAKTYSGFSIASSQRLLKTINSLLDASMIISHQDKIRNSESILEHDVEDVVAKLSAEYAVNNRITIHTKSNHKHLIKTDRSKLMTIVEELLDNSIKFCPEGPIKITIDADISDKTLNLSIKDKGIGIASGMLERIFEPFRQGDESFEREYEGIGLGLFIAKSYANMLNGDIKVVSTPQEGSDFTLTLKFLDIQKVKKTAWIKNLTMKKSAIN